MNGSATFCSARVGGYLEARRIHDVAAAHGIPVWCGGMLETGIGRGPDLALAALPGFVLPGDVSASRRYFAEDLTEPGIGVEPIPQTVRRFTTATKVLYPKD